MKKLLWLLIPLTTLMLSCQKEAWYGGDENQTDGEKKFGAVDNGVKTPMKGIFYGIPTAANTTCVPGKSTLGAMVMGGSVTHLGDMQLMHSTWTNTQCSFDPATMTVTQSGPGQLMADNGDIMYIAVVVRINATTQTFVGESEITGGTGRFAGCTGYVDVLNGVIGPERLTWDIDGWVILKKK